MTLQELLAPTWQARARAEDALLAAMVDLGAEKEPVWPEAVQLEIRALQPSPDVFLSALVGFWADVALQQFRGRLPEPDPAWDAALSREWASPHAARFPMTPTEPPASANMMRGLWVWNFIEKLGPCGALIERQLLACLDHPEPVVWDAAESALGAVEHWSDAGFARFLAVAERRGRGGQIWKRARIAARHLNPERVALVLDGLEPGADETLALARFAILERLDGELAPTAYRHLLHHLGGAWPDAERAYLIRALTPLSRKLGFDSRAVARIKTLIHSENGELQCAAVGFLVAHSPAKHLDLFMGLLADSQPQVLGELCRGLAHHPKIPPELVRLAISRGLGNYDGYDGEPHDSAVALLKERAGRHARIALAEIVAWWETASSDPYLERSAIADALALAEVLGAAAAPLQPGMERALASLVASPPEEAWPDLDQPGAISDLQERLQAAMTEAGTPPEIASAAGGFYADILRQISENQETIQQEIDDFQDRYEAEQRALYPELQVAESETESDLNEEEGASDEEDELIVRLRAWLNAIDLRD